MCFSNENLFKKGKIEDEHKLCLRALNLLSFFLLTGLYQQDQIQEKNPKDSLAVVIGCTVGFVVVVAVVVVFLLLWRRHKMMASKKKTQEPVVVYRDASATIVSVTSSF